IDDRPIATIRADPHRMANDLSAPWRARDLDEGLGLHGAHGLTDQMLCDGAVRELEVTVIDPDQDAELPLDLVRQVDHRREPARSKGSSHPLDGQWLAANDDLRKRKEHELDITPLGGGVTAGTAPPELQL